VELIPIPVNESRANENKQDCEHSSLQKFHVGSLYKSWSLTFN
jgi:hypothetical protein